MNIEKLTISKRSTYTVLAITCIVLLTPFTAMFFTQEVNWGVLDFAVAGGLLFFFGYVHQVLTAGSKSLAMHILISGVVFALLLLVWSQLI
ncbi:hypothetical protein CWE15_08445 [Aliidiomarina taiwanensis]|uniref:Uncharacterized protein n=1 Tax=Aliidiomarina taiwanensis TaxID=946228 RepID=A0A432X0U8_9GAMM|nr:hypothetical protein [Aliidiomarina taiwanensis]RUO39779.1 hypothetical protein CWE15_08445 [Aliidiomarina taiwanensis]